MPDILIPVKTPAVAVPRPLKQDYGTLLRMHKLSFRAEQLFYRVGHPSQGLGWIIHLSVVETQVHSLMEQVLPFLAKEKVPFKIYCTQDVTFQVIAGDLGYTQIGKVVSIYPRTDTQALDIVRWALQLPRTFKGPAVPTDKHLGGIVHVRYGCPNPTVLVDDRGISRNYYVNQYGQQVEDVYTVPYAHPKAIEWPFLEFADEKPPRDPKFFKRRYGIYKLLKRDAKGVVALGVNVSNLFFWKWCLVKQGKSNMCHDANGRDIVDRLTWQLDLQLALAKKVRMPKIIDFFKKHGNAYLIMEFIDGVSFRNLIVRTLRSRVWTDLPRQDQDKLLTHAINILDQVALFHAEGYVHRDVTPNNFVIRKGLEYMIDLEMAYSIPMDRPHPPFRLGTFGYMSPEQLETRPPTIKEDIYGFGATLIFLFTGIEPFKFCSADSEQTRNHILFFTGDESIASLIANCTSFDASVRPTLSEIRLTLSLYKDRPTERTAKEALPGIDPVKLKPFIQAGINALARKEYLSSENLWLSRTVQDSNLAGNQRMDRQVLPGLAEGIAGVLAVLAQASALHFSMNAVSRFVGKAAGIFSNDVHSQLAMMPTSLYGGSAGVAVALHHALTQRLVTKKAEYQEWLQDFPGREADQAGLAYGAAGQLIAILATRNHLPQKLFDGHCNTKIRQILAAQDRSGNFSIVQADGTKSVSPWFSEGTAGVVYALCQYLPVVDNDDVRHAVSKAMKPLSDAAKRQLGVIKKSTKPNSEISPRHGLRNGSAGLALAFLAAYQVFSDKSYRETAEQLLQAIPARPVLQDMTMATGLAGIGQVYLEAAALPDGDEWQQRANWITLTILHQALKDPDGTIQWYADSNFITTADLANGQAGILHYLLRYQDPETIQPMYF